MHTFKDYLSESDYKIIRGFTNPFEIQAFLDRTPYSTEELNRTPVQVIQDRTAHCLDGALFGAAALRELGFPPILIDLFPEAGTDDDHVLAIFEQNGCFGAIAKSNFPGLRLREPVYRTYRELLMSYFEVFFNIHGKKTLRSYTRPLNLSQFDKRGWIDNHAGVQAIERRLLSLDRIPLITQAMEKQLFPVDPLSYQSGTVGVNPDGLYKPH